MFAFSKLNTQNKFITAKAITLYSGIIKNLIFKLKYSDNLNIAPFFSKLLNQLYIKQELHADLIVPIPMHIKSIIQKQYNHTEILASHFARYIKIPYSTKSIIKIRATEKQGLLSRAKRLTNLSGAFKIYDASLIKNKNLILLDDVITTSSTMRECVKVLLKSGAKSIHVLAIAKTI
ncbi:MAG: phosphoribosyltransferase family protein [Proteobacteria bacterium]|nr:phosphoribosyltransferase family protein [Pseudomonadota bacterium]